jgi:hypothetical protein
MLPDADAINFVLLSSTDEIPNGYIGAWKP